MRRQWRKRRGHQANSWRERRGLYFVSATRGRPRLARCARIWWVRPVTGLTRSRVKPAEAGGAGARSWAWRRYRARGPASSSGRRSPASTAARKRKLPSTSKSVWASLPWADTKARYLLLPILSLQRTSPCNPGGPREAPLHRQRYSFETVCSANCLFRERAAAELSWPRAAMRTPEVMRSKRETEPTELQVPSAASCRCSSSRARSVVMPAGLTAATTPAALPSTATSRGDPPWLLKSSSEPEGSSSPEAPSARRGPPRVPRARPPAADPSSDGLAPPRDSLAHHSPDRSCSTSSSGRLCSHAKSPAPVSEAWRRPLDSFRAPGSAPSLPTVTGPALSSWSTRRSRAFASSSKSAPAGQGSQPTSRRQGQW
mmetsp:Transcript_71866/g.221987  ORF Transcript_71866/g.221987 Transcript_71866/m.221987 type:complete len:372 (+) Transcript_71866:204-1319(+)